MLILEHDVLEVIIFSFMDHLRPAISGEIQYNTNKNSLSFGLTSGGEVASSISPSSKQNEQQLMLKALALESCYCGILTNSFDTKLFGFHFRAANNFQAGTGQIILSCQTYFAQT